MSILISREYKANWYTCIRRILGQVLCGSRIGNILSVPHKFYVNEIMFQEAYFIVDIEKIYIFPRIFKYLSEKVSLKK